MPTFYVINETKDRIESAWNSEEYAEGVAAGLNQTSRTDEYYVSTSATEEQLAEYSASGRWY